MKKTALITMILFAALAAAIAPALAKEKSGDAAKNEAKKEVSPEDAVKKIAKKGGEFAVIDTSMGRIICQLYRDKAPLGVDNFVGLAEGTKEFTDPKTGEKTKRRFYDGLIFHRVIPNFMIQGGDPLGSGMGGPGYRFKNEISSDLKFDKAGRLAYANAGPDTNGSQFFITHKDTSYLNGGYTIFGQTVAGQDVVDAIGAVPRNPSDRPLTPVVINKVTIVKIEAGKKKK
jgi:peptidyl-prolyl cis-trans isomerase A (cyclophilin A)